MDIANEKDPFLREIYAAGYTDINEDIVNCKMQLIDVPNKLMKEIDLFDYLDIKSRLPLKKGTNLSGNIYTWISEEGGAADYFRQLIKKK